MSGGGATRAWPAAALAVAAGGLVAAAERFGPDAYQAFIDYRPVSRFNNFENFSRSTREGGVHSFPAGDARALPALIDQFDWAIVNKRFEHFRAADPQSVWLTPKPGNLEFLLEAAESTFDPSRADRVLVVGNEDVWLSEALGGVRGSGVDDPEGYARQRDLARPRMLATVGRLRAFFWRIFFEAKDVEVEGVRTMPIGLTEFFLRGGVAETAAAAIASASVADKPGMVKGAFNFYHDLSHCTRGWGEAQRLRTAARDWSRGAAARAARVDSTLTKRADWWAEVARHRFLMAPNGCGVQTPKQLEALLVLTIPIARRGPYPAFDDLVRYGFPLVVVDEWDDLTPERLSSWWEEMSPRLPSFRDNCLTSDGYWRLFTGEAERCQ